MLTYPWKIKVPEFDTDIEEAFISEHYEEIYEGINNECPALFPNNEVHLCDIPEEVDEYIFLHMWKEYKKFERKMKKGDKK